MPRSRSYPVAIAGLAACVLASACAVGPNYRRAPVETPPAFEGIAGWTPARPADEIDRGAWWSVFNDPVLDELERRVDVSNQTLAAAEAAYRQARALVAEQQAQFFPTVDLSGSATRSQPAGGGKIVSGSTVTNTASRGATNTYQVSLGGSWAPDLWGRIRRQIEGAKASAQASAADVVGARLSAQSELAVDYIQLRLADAETAIFRQTVDDYARTLQIVENQYANGVAAKSDVLSARSQLASAQASLLNVGTQRAQDEHAIALLTGRPPSEVSIAPLPDWAPSPPVTPVETPSLLLQRRPDIASAERQAASSSAQIGVQMAAYFPNITLTGSGSGASTAVTNLLSPASTGWAIGANLAQTVFNAGQTGASVRAARAAYDQARANYRQTVLAAFAQVEDDLAAARILQAEEAPLTTAAQDAVQARQIAVNEYRAGTVTYTTVATAEAAELNARQTLLSSQVQRMTTAVSLIEALGGGWEGLGHAGRPD